MKHSFGLLCLALCVASAAAEPTASGRHPRIRRQFGGNFGAQAQGTGQTAQGTGQNAQAAGQNAQATGQNAQAAGQNAQVTGQNTQNTAQNANANANTNANANANAANANTNNNGGNNKNNNNGNNNNNNNNNNGGNANNLATSLTVDPSVIQAGSAQNGNPKNGQVASLTSTNNFINFCATNNGGAPLMNGTQTKSVTACNPIPMGMIVGQNNMPSGKFTNPANLATLQANQEFDITMKIQNLVTGNFVNPQTNYFSAPAQIDPTTGNIIGHSHFVVEAIDSLSSTTVTNPLEFAFFKGVDPPAQNGIMTVNVPGGLPAGTYRLGSMNSAANHQPVLATIAQHGLFDDVVYFTVK